MAARVFLSALAHADRSRFVDDEVRRRIQAEGLAVGSLLVDGTAGGTWTTNRRDGTQVLTIRVIEPIRDSDLEEVAAEASRLLEFLAPRAARREVAFARPA